MKILSKFNLTNKKRKCKIGLAFGGGGTRGFAHLGVLKAFEENGIVVDEVAGTSVGSMVASAYAYGLSSDEMYNAVKNLKVSDIRNSRLFFMPSNTNGIQKLVKQLIGDAHFEDMKKPLTVVAVDIKSGKEIHITKGSVVKAVAGSCAVPGIFDPVDFGEYRLVDGGLQNTIPADVLRKNGCKYVISIDVNPTRGYGTDSLKITEILEASLRILMKSNAVKGSIFSDIVIEANTSEFKSTSLEGSEEMYKIGYDSAMKLMPQIKEIIAKCERKEFNWFGLFKKNKNKVLKNDDGMINLWVKVKTKEK